MIRACQIRSTDICVFVKFLKIDFGIIIIIFHMRKRKKNGKVSSFNVSFGKLIFSYVRFDGLHYRLH